MTNKKTTKRALLMSALSLLMCVSMLVGSTFAWFTDSVTSGINKIEAGNLDIELWHSPNGTAQWGHGYDEKNAEQIEGDTSLFLNKEGKPILWEPGAGTGECFRIKNAGSLALKYQFRIEATDVIKTPDGKALSDVLKMQIVQLQILENGAPAGVVGGVYYEDVLGDGYLIEGELLPGETDDFNVTIDWVPSANDNDYNVKGGLAIDFGVTLIATQLAHEFDSYDNQYDKDAWAEGMVADDADELKAALTAGGKVNLGADVELKEPVVINKDTVVDLGGYTLTSANGEILKATDGAKVEITNGAIEANSADGNALTVTNTKADTTTSVSLTNVKVDLADVGDANLNAIHVGAEKGKAVLNVGDGTAINVAGKWSTAILANKNAEVNVTGGEINVDNTSGDGVFAIYIEDSSAVVNVSGGVFNITGNHSASGIVAWDAAPTVNISGGVFNVATTGGYGIAVEVWYGQVNATGGTFNINATTGSGAYAFEVTSKVGLNVSSDVTINVLKGYKNTAYSSGNDNPDGCDANINVATIVSTDAELAGAIASASKTEETVIMLATGTYSQDILLDARSMEQKGDLVFKAADGAEPVITGTVTLGYYENKVGSKKWDANVTFEGVAFDHAEPQKHSLSVQSLKSITLRGCTIIGDGEYGIGSQPGNDTGASLIERCKFVNAGMQIYGNFGTDLVIDRCDFEESQVNVSGGNGVTIQNCTFNKTLTDVNNGDSFYVIRSPKSGTPVTVKNCQINVDSNFDGTAVPADGKAFAILHNRHATAAWTITDVTITMTDAAKAQSNLKVIETVGGAMNTTNVTVNGVAL